MQTLRLRAFHPRIFTSRWSSTNSKPVVSIFHPNAGTFPQGRSSSFVPPPKESPRHLLTDQDRIDAFLSGQNGSQALNHSEVRNLVGIIFRQRLHGPFQDLLRSPRDEKSKRDKNDRRDYELTILKEVLYQAALRTPANRNIAEEELFCSDDQFLSTWKRVLELDHERGCYSKFRNPKTLRNPKEPPPTNFDPMTARKILKLSIDSIAPNVLLLSQKENNINFAEVFQSLWNMSEHPSPITQEHMSSPELTDHPHGAWHPTDPPAIRLALELIVYLVRRAYADDTLKGAYLTLSSDIFRQLFTSGRISEKAASRATPEAPSTPSKRRSPEEQRMMITTILLYSVAASSLDTGSYSDGLNALGLWWDLTHSSLLPRTTTSQAIDLAQDLLLGSLKGFPNSNVIRRVSDWLVENSGLLISSNDDTNDKALLTILEKFYSEAHRQYRPDLIERVWRRWRTDSSPSTLCGLHNAHPTISGMVSVLEYLGGVPSHGKGTIVARTAFQKKEFLSLASWILGEIKNDRISRPEALMSGRILRALSMARVPGCEVMDLIREYYSLLPSFINSEGVRTPLLDAGTLIKMVKRAHSTDPTFATQLTDDFRLARSTPGTPFYRPTGPSHEDLTSLGRCYFVMGEHVAAFTAFREMLQRRMVPDLYDISVILAGLTLVDPERGRQALESAIESGVQPDARTFYGMIDSTIRPALEGRSIKEAWDHLHKLLDIAHRMGFENTADLLSTVLPRLRDYVKSIEPRSARPDARRNLLATLAQVTGTVSPPHVTTFIAESMRPKEKKMITGDLEEMMDHFRVGRDYGGLDEKVFQAVLIRVIENKTNKDDDQKRYQEVFEVFCKWKKETLGRNAKLEHRTYWLLLRGAMVTGGGNADAIGEIQGWMKRQGMRLNAALTKKVRQWHRKAMDEGEERDFSWITFTGEDNNKPLASPP